MKSLIASVRAALVRVIARKFGSRIARIFGYKVSVIMQCPGRGLVAVTHYAVSYAGALDWARQYPLTDSVVIRELFMGRVAMFPVGVR